MAVPLRRNVVTGIVIGGVLVAVFAFLGWALLVIPGFRSMTGGSRALAILITAGVVGTGALAGILMWLAFYSARKGYDDPPTYENDETQRKRRSGGIT